MTPIKQQKYLDKVAQWLCDDTQYYINPMIIGDTGIILYFPFIDDDGGEPDGFHLSILDVKPTWPTWCGPDLQKVCFESIFSTYVRYTYGVHGEECEQLWDLYRNKLKRQWEVH